MQAHGSHKLGHRLQLLQPRPPYILPPAPWGAASIRMTHVPVPAAVCNPLRVQGGYPSSSYGIRPF